MHKEISSLDHYSVRQFRTFFPCLSFKWCTAIILIGIVLTLWSSLAFSQQSALDVCKKTLLPEPAMKLLGQKFPTWRVFTFNDLTAEEQGMWRQAPWKNECPGIAVGHFEAKDRNTYAVVLVPKNNNKASFRLIVMNGRGRTYTVKVLEQSNEVYGPVVYTIPPGDHQYYDNDERKQIHLSLDGFQVEWMARVANLYYWKDGKYESVSVMF